MGLIIFVIYFIGISGSAGLAYYFCTKKGTSVEQAAVGSALLGYFIGSIVGIWILGLEKG